MSSSEARSLPQLLEGYRYVNLTTFRKRSGRPVATPVWFALAGSVGERAYVLTGLHSGKAKRIRAGSRILLTPSDWRGRPLDATSTEAVARSLEGEEAEAAGRALRDKYGWQYRLFNLVQQLPREPAEHVFLELRPLSGLVVG